MTTPHTEEHSRRASLIQEDTRLSNPSSANKDLEDQKDEYVTDTQELDRPHADEKDVRGPTGEKFKQLSWLRLTSVLIVEAIALGSLSMPSTFATVGMVPGIICTIGIGLIAIYTSINIGEVWLQEKSLVDYSLACRKLGERMFGPRWGGSFGYWFTAVAFLLLLTFTTASHSLTGKVAFNALSDNAICGVGFSAIAAVILFILALPKTFSEMGILGYIDFISICSAILITIVASGVDASKLPGGIDSVQWHAFPPADKMPTFAEAFLSITNIVFAYAFAQCQFSFMSELRVPTDYKKSVVLLGSLEIFIYTITGSLIYAFAGDNVQSPALLSTSGVIPKVAFGVALPVIFISGSINTVVAARFIYSVTLGKQKKHENIDGVLGNTVWVGLVFGITVVAWVIAEAIPFFNALLGIIASLFITFFSFVFPGLFYNYILREGAWNKNKKTMFLSVANWAITLMGLFILVAGLYASAVDIKSEFDSGEVGSPFSCAA
ncbi:unnamed protein product [Sympodiomycopsis kandeliae]